MRRTVVAGITALVAVAALVSAALATANGSKVARTQSAKAHRSLNANVREAVAGKAPRLSHGQTPWVTSPNWPAGMRTGDYSNGSPAWAASDAARAPQVLRVGTYRGIPGQFKTIQAAVDAASPYDLILIAPGDYKTTSDRIPSNSNGDFPAGVLITKPDLTIRGMNRNTVIVDDTTTGPPCNSIAGDQNFGPSTSSGPAGLNGLMVWKSDNDAIENLTACNFPGGAGGDGGTGNEIWWNGGADSGTIGGWGYYGAYITGTTLFYNNETQAAQYGIFSSNWDGGMWSHAYASNMNDSGFYIGACQQQCNQVINDAWSEYSALGYSGTNSGGSMVIENSQWDNNEDGFDTNSQNADEPAPQNGSCPNNGTSPVTHTHSCWVFMDNWAHDNNDNAAPAAGSAAAGPVGTGMTLSGGRNDTVMDNRFENNDAWGNAFVPYPDSGPPCDGGTGGQTAGQPCIFDEWNDALIDNYYKNNGSYKNPTNGDFGFTSLEPGDPTDCFSGNTDADGNWTSAPSGLQTTYPTCNGQVQPTPEDSNPQSSEFLAQIGCDSGIGLAFGESVPCPPGSNYPKIAAPVLHPLPAAANLATMPDPCGGVPSNPWCSGQTTKVKGCAAPTVKVPLSLAVGETLRFVTVNRGGVKKVYSAKQVAKGLRVALGRASHHSVRVKVTELITVGSHQESVTFTRIYKRCS